MGAALRIARKDLRLRVRDRSVLILGIIGIEFFGAVEEQEQQPSPHMPTATTAATHEQITRRAFELWCENGRRPGTAEDDWRAAERELIYRTLQHTRWNRREAAEILGISYKALLYKIKEAELDRAS